MGNSFFNEYPYTDFHELNLSWVIKELRTFATTLEQFVSINALKYADPIQWNITTQYEKNTIVIDPVSGVAYISVAPVPAGVIITNTDYWTPVFDLGALTEKAGRNLTDKYEEETTLTATFPSNTNDWIIWGDVLYRVLSPIIAGDQYVVGSNIEHFTIESILGHIEDLDTTDKSNLVAAINEVLTTLVNTTGDLDDLNTTDKTNLVAAINEVLTTLVNTTGNLNDLNTTDKSNLVASINENYASISKLKTYHYNVKDFGAVGDGVTDDTAAIQACFDAITTENINGNKDLAGAVFPNGHYLITSQLILPANCEIIGNYPSIGKAYHKLPDADTNGSWLYIDDTTADNTQINVDNDNGTICLRDGTIMRGFGIYYPNQTNGSSPTAYRPTFYLGKYANTQLIDIYAVNPYRLYFAQVRHAHAELHNIRMCALKCGIESYYGPEGDIFENIEHTLNYFAYCDTVDVNFTNYIKSNLYFIYLHGADWPRIMDCGCYGGYKAYVFTIYDDNGTNRGVRHCSMQNCFAEVMNYTTIQTYSNANNDVAHDNLWVEGGVYHTSGDSQAMLLNGINDAHFHGITVRAYQHGINAVQCNLLDVNGCHFFDYGERSGLNGRGIITAASKNVIIGNQFNGQKSAHARGVYLAGAQSDPIVCDNVFYDMVSSNPCIENVGTVVRAKILNNSFPDVSNPVIGTYDRSNVYQHGYHGYLINNLVKTYSGSGTTDANGIITFDKSTYASDTIISVYPVTSGCAAMLMEDGEKILFLDASGSPLASTTVSYRVTFI